MSRMLALECTFWVRWPAPHEIGVVMYPCKTDTGEVGARSIIRYLLLIQFGVSLSYSRAILEKKKKILERKEDECLKSEFSSHLLRGVHHLSFGV